MEISIVTLNCFYNPLSNNSFRIKSALLEIAKLKPDIICLQEVISPRQTNISREILKSLNYNLYYVPSLYFTKGGLIFATKFSLGKCEFVKFKNQGKLLSLQITDRILAKGFQKIELNINSKKVSIYNTHIVSRYKNTSFEEKNEQSKQLEELIKIINSDQSMYKICFGDFNIQSHGDYYSHFIDKTDLIDSLGENQITFSSKNIHIKKRFNIDFDSRIDYVLYSKNIKNIETKVVFDTPLNISNKLQPISDHFGIYSTLEI